MCSYRARARTGFSRLTMDPRGADIYRPDTEHAGAIQVPIIMKCMEVRLIYAWTIQLHVALVLSLLFHKGWVYVCIYDTSQLVLVFILKCI